MHPSQILNYGAVEEGMTAYLNVTLFNSTDIELKLKVEIQPKHGYEDHCEQFALMPLPDNAVRSWDLTLPASKSASIPVYFKPLGYERSEGRRMHEILLRTFFVPDFQISHTAFGKTMMRKDSPAFSDVGSIKHSITVLGQVGYSKLQVPQNCQSLHFACGVGQVSIPLL